MRFKCPTCGKSGEVAGFDALPTFPFCSERCKLVDLGRWIDGAFAIPDQAPAGSAGAAAGSGPAQADPDMDLEAEDD